MSRADVDAAVDALAAAKQVKKQAREADAAADAALAAAQEAKAASAKNVADATNDEEAKKQAAHESIDSFAAEES